MYKTRSILGVAICTITNLCGLAAAPAPSSFAHKPAKNKKVDALPIQLETPSGTLLGTLDVPVAKPPWPVALVITGSGPTDRDGNQPAMKNDSLRLLGRALAEHGIAALRYDKRGVAKSFPAGPMEEKLRFGAYIDDAVGWVKLVRRDPRFNQVVIIGHSEGSLIGVIAAKHESCDALISLEGAGRNLATLLRDQLKRNLPSQMFDESSHIIDELLAGRKVDSIAPELLSLFRPSVQPYLMTWLKYDPTKEIADLKIPILIIQGTTDLQVSVDDAKMLAAASKTARLVTIDNMNHVLKHTSATSLLGQMTAYSDPSLPLAPHLTDEISSFLQRSLPKRTRSESE